MQEQIRKQEKQKLNMNLSSFLVPVSRAMCERVCVSVKSLQLCPTLCKPMDCSLPGPSVHGILQARIPEWVAVPSSRGSPQLNLCLRSEPVSQVS